MNFHPPNLDFEVVVQLTLAGAAVAGLTDLDFSLGVVAVQSLDPDAPSPPLVNLTGGTEFTVEELQPGRGLGMYALKFVGAVIPLEGQYSLSLVKPGTFDPLAGVLDVRPPSDIDEALSLLGKNVVGIPSGYDANGQVTGLTLYFFSTAADAQTYIDDYMSVPVGAVTPASQALVTGFLEEAAVYHPSTSLLQAFIRKRV